MLEPTEAENKYIRVNQDGIAILLDASPAEYVGCFTEGLQSCIAIALVGTNGIALIHDTGKLSIESIQDACRRIGRISHSAFYYNPTFAERAFVNMGRYKSIKELGFKNKKAEVAPRGFVSIKRHSSAGEHRCNTSENPAPSVLISPTASRLRQRILVLNNFFLAEAEKIAGDIQFDGRSFTDLCPLSKSFEQIKRLISSSPKYSSGTTTDRGRARDVTLICVAQYALMQAFRVEWLAKVAARETPEAISLYEAVAQAVFDTLTPPGVFPEFQDYVTFFAFIQTRIAEGEHMLAERARPAYRGVAAIGLGAVETHLPGLLEGWFIPEHSRRAAAASTMGVFGVQQAGTLSRGPEGSVDKKELPTAAAPKS